MWINIIYLINSIIAVSSYLQRKMLFNVFDIFPLKKELKELAALAYRDTTEENREFWKSELSQAIRDIQSEYDNKVDQIRGDMESYYNLKVSVA